MWSAKRSSITGCSTFRRATLIVLGTALSLLAQDLAAQQRAQGPGANNFAVIQTSDPATAARRPEREPQEHRWSVEEELEQVREMYRQLKDVLLLRAELARARETSARLENELTQRTQLLRGQIEHAQSAREPQQWQQAEVARVQAGRLPAAEPGNQGFENTVR
jgi:hypothetical protein